MLSETVTESKFEHVMKGLAEYDKIQLPRKISNADRKHIQVFTCNKCGKLERFVEDI